MSDSNIKKSKIKYIDLPPIDTESNSYKVRYRIVSEDKNRISHWSQIYDVSPDFTYQSVLTDIAITSTNSTASITWGLVKVNKVVGSTTNFISNQKEFDIFIKWGKSGNGDWLYKNSVIGNATSALIPDSYIHNGVVINEKPNQLSVKVFVKSSNPVVSNTDLLVYSITAHTV